MNTTSDALLPLNRTFLFNRIQNDPKTPSESQMFSCSKSLTDCWGKNPLSSNLYLKMNLLGEKVRKWGPFFEMPISTFPKKNGIVREKCLFFFFPSYINSSLRVTVMRCDFHVAHSAVTADAAERGVSDEAELHGCGCQSAAIRCTSGTECWATHCKGAWVVFFLPVKLN